MEDSFAKALLSLSTNEFADVAALNKVKITNYQTGLGITRLN